MKRKVVALTGGIGSGKSVVADILREMGFATVDCDEISKKVASRPDVIAEVKAVLGKKAVINGQLDRQYVRDTIFVNEKLHAEYSAIFWKRIREDLVDTLRNIQGTVFVEIPVLDAFEFCWDEVWLVESDVRLRTQRVVARDGVSFDSVEKVISLQKRYNATRTLTNNGDLRCLKQSVLQALSASQLV